MTAFQKAEALATQLYDRDKLLALVDEVTTHFRMPNSFERSKMRAVCRYRADALIAAADQLCNSAGRISRSGFGRSGKLASIEYWTWCCGNVEAMLTAYEFYGKPLNFVVRKFAIELGPNVYEEARTIELQLRQENPAVLRLSSLCQTLCRTAARLPHGRSGRPAISRTHSYTTA